tara:strand:- start:154 stop:600 length:447 start_codon:yes stop_codon:yes gene_type:complete
VEAQPFVGRNTKELTMIKSLKHIAIIGALGIGSSIAILPATAQLGLGVGVGVETDVDARVGVRSGDPHARHSHAHYVYDGYESDRWHTRHEVRREQTWNARYNGYDCYDSFQYTWEDGERVRYDSTFCYDDRGRKYEAKDARVVVRIR